MLLSEQRGAVRRQDRDGFTVAQILAWAEAHHARTGRWPAGNAEAIPEAPGATWEGIDRALRRGFRGLEAGSSLARLLAAERGARNRRGLPAFTEPQVLAWADGYRSRHGRWPQPRSGPIEDAPGETWAAVDSALRNGQRGFPCGSSLALLIKEYREN